MMKSRIKKMNGKGNVQHCLKPIKKLYLKFNNYKKNYYRNNKLFWRYNKN
jgi:hypothetical protein